MKTIYIPWGAWYQEKDFELLFPENWDIRMCKLNDTKGIDDNQIRDALLNPIGTGRISSLAKGKKTVAIAVEDITRPSYLGNIVSLIIDELNSGGIKKGDIKLIICNGAHRPLHRIDLLKKLGHYIVENYLIINHNPYDNLTDVGIIMGSLPVMINKFFMDADFKIIVGSILPHAFAGFSGGAKLVIPGLSGIDILSRSHKFVLMGLRGGAGEVENNKFRTEIEKVVLEIGTDFFVGYVPNTRREIAGIFVGDIIVAHRTGVKFAKKVFETEVPDGIDIVVLNAYPKDTEFLQADTVFSIMKASINKIKSDGTIIVTSACSEGFGYHSLFSPGMRLYRAPSKKRFLSGRSLLFFSPNINNHEFYINFWEGYSLFNKWEDLIDSLDKKYSHSCKVAVFPTAPLQLVTRNTQPVTQNS